MKPNFPTHETITLRAQEIWNARGTPHGTDDAIWFEAERQLATEAQESSVDHAEETNTSFDPFGRNRTDGFGKETSLGSSAPDPIEIAAKATTQKHAASAPRFPTRHTAPSVPVPPSGKPLWNKPHSS